jgi:Cys-tRNA(Pro)/Cys-tRNA(Cys) deacylase
VKKSKRKKTFVEQILDKAKIAYEPLFLNALTDDLPTNINKSDIYKTLALTGEKGPIIGIVPLTHQLSEKKLAKISGNNKVTMIPQKALQKTTGYVHGANTPIGIRQKHQFPIIIDDVALSKAFIIISAGEIGRSVKLNPQILADFVNASFADISEKTTY